MDYYLSFENEAAAKAVLYRIEGAQPGDPEMGIEAKEGYEVANYANIDTIGVMYEKRLADAPADYQPVPIPGWHVNVRVVDGEDVSALEQYAVVPSTPMRVWG